MKKQEQQEAQKVPFFVRFLEKQETRAKPNAKAGVDQTLKYPSDSDEGVLY